jgi:Flp pilus assembly pilin Flp
MLRRLVSEFCRNESGAAGAEWAFVASILVLGSVVGLLAVRAELLGCGNGGELPVPEVQPETPAGR